MNRLDFDCIIVGGGMTGALASLALANSGLSCALIDASHLLTDEPGQFDGRTTAIAYAGTRMLERLGLWQELVPDAGVIKDILVTDGRPRNRFQPCLQSNHWLHFDAALLDKPDAPQEALGYVLENRRLQQSLAEAIQHNTNIHYFPLTLVTQTSPDSHGVRVTLDSGDALHTKLLVAADGRTSGLRARANIKTTHWPYKQTGIVCTLNHTQEHQNIAQEFFLPGGPFAILPMLGNQVSIVWTEKSDRAESYLNLSQARFLSEIQNRMGDYLGDVSLAGSRWRYPLHFHLAHRFIAPRLVLLGDAAHTIHPIAGQGFNLAIKDIAVLVDCLTQTRRVGLDIGHGSALQRYERWRRFDVVSMALGTDALNRLFSNDNAPLRFLRNKGISAVNKINPLRSILIRHAGSDLGDLPSLMRAFP